MSDVANQSTSYHDNDIDREAQCTGETKNATVKSDQSSNKRRKEDGSSILPENLPFPTSFSTLVQAI